MSDERSLLEPWWDMVVAKSRQKLIKQRPLPHDGASWVCYTNYMGLGGFYDPRIEVKFVNPLPVMAKCLELWLDAKKQKVQDGK